MIDSGAVRQLLGAATAVLIGAGIALADPPARVTACGSDTQTGAGLNLAQALGAGGEIGFSCPAGTTIRVTGRYVLKQNTVIDGGDAVTLDGGGSIGPMLSSSQNIILRRITLRGFAQKPPPAPGGGISLGRIHGSVLAALGDAELDHVTVEASDFPIDVAGTATVKDSAFVGNRGGLTLAVNGVGHIENCRFTGNGRELSINAGWVRICSFNGQTAGALTVHLPSGPVEIRHSTFSGIRGGPPVALSQRAGSNGPQTITLRANTFRDNDGGPSAGAIALTDPVQEARDRGASVSVIKALSKLPPASFVFSYNRFTNNRGSRGGAIAADLAHTGGMVSTGDLFVGNGATGDGGAVAVSGGASQISHALLKANRAGGRGAALNVAPGGSASISNTLVVGNEGPNGTIAGDAVRLTNVTVADNQAVGLLLSGKAQVGNILLAHNVPADCASVPAGVFQGGGLQSDGTCPSLPVGEAFLDSFYVPGANSPALTGGDAALCRSPAVAGVDLVFQARNNADNCALGAFERAPLRKFAPKTETHPVHANPADEFSDDDPYKPPPVQGAYPQPTPSNSPNYSPSVTATSYPTSPSPSYPSSNNIPEIIEKAATSQLGIFALMIVAVSIIAFLWFQKRSNAIRISILAVLFAGVVWFGVAVSRQMQEVREAKQELATETASHRSPAEPAVGAISHERQAAAPPGLSSSPQNDAEGTPMHSVLAAVKAEEASPIERVRVFMTQGSVADEYYIDRVNPGRFRMLVNPRQGGPERIAVDRMQWVRTAGSKPWFKTPAQEPSAPFPFTAELFRHGLSRAVESPGPGGSRNVEGDFAWTNGTACEGKMLLRIDAGGLPSLFRFEGNCDKKPVRFRVAFSYRGPVIITPPQ